MAFNEDCVETTRERAGVYAVPLLVVVLLACVGGATSQAQVVRGNVRESPPGTAVAGVLVTLERVANDTGGVEGLIGVLTNERGEFALRAPSPGRYRLSAKRIGVRRTVTDPFELALGETRQVVIEIEAVLFTLPEVSVATASFCITKSDQVRQVAALWDEVRTALTAASISVRDSLYRGRVVRFLRLTDRRGRILNESTQEQEGLLKSFASVHPESLSVRGFWREEKDSVVFDAPDIDVLLSPAFLRDHCFELAAERRGETGLRFQPGRSRFVADVSGTMWVDARSFELRRIEFTYTRLPRGEAFERSGGDVHFGKLTSGAWVVRRWAIRTPLIASTSRRPQVERRFGMVDPRVRLGSLRVVENRFIEEGGVAQFDGVLSFEQPSTIRGVVFDSTGAVFTSALVRLAGTNRAVAVDAAGRFQFDSVPPGLYKIEAASELHAALGTSAAEQEVAIEPGARATVSLRETGLDGLLSRMCGGRAVARNRSAVRILLIDATTGEPYPGQPLRLWWNEYVRDRGVQRVVQQQLDAVTATDGSAVFCGLPVDVRLELGQALTPDRARRLETLRLTSRTPRAHTIRSG